MPHLRPRRFRLVFCALFAASLVFTAHAGLLESFRGRIEPRNRQSLRQNTMKSSRPTLGKARRGGSGSISGKLLYPDDGRESYEATVVVLDSFGYEVFEDYLWRDSAFTADSLRDGKYLVGAKWSYDEPLNFHGNTRDPHAATRVSVAGNAVSGIDVTLPPQGLGQAPAFEPVTIEGMCYVGSGTDSVLDYAAIIFFAVPTDSSEGVRRITGKVRQGEFTATGRLRPGQYYLMVAIRDSEYASSDLYRPQWWDGTMITDAPKPVDIAGSISGKEIHVEQGRILRGEMTVEDDEWRPDYARVTLLDSAGHKLASEHVQNGTLSFTMTGLAPGSYYLKASWYSSGWGTEYAVYYPNAENHRSATRITIPSDTDPDPVTMRLPASMIGASNRGSLSGRITEKATGEGIEASILVDYCAPQLEDDWIWTHSNGTIVENEDILSDEPFVLQISPEIRDYYLANTWYPDATSPATAETLTVAEGATVTIDQALAAGGSIAGFFRSEDGAPVSFSRGLSSSTDNMMAVYAWQEENPDAFFYGESTILGAIRINGLPAATYSFVAFPLTLGSAQTEVHSFSRVNGQQVTAGTTTIFPQQNLTRPTGGIEGVANSGKHGVSMLLCYNSDSLLVSGNYVGDFDALMGPSNPDENDVLGAILGYDHEMRMRIRSPKDVPFTIAGLPAGKYTFCKIGILEPDSVEWFGGINTAATVNDLTIARARIPEGVQWITIDEGERVRDVTMDGVGIDRSNPAAGATRPTLSVNTNSGRVLVRYRLPANQGASIDFYSCSGRRAASFPVREQTGTVRWDRPEGAAGVWTVVMRCGGHRLIRRVMLVR